MHSIKAAVAKSEFIDDKIKPILPKKRNKKTKVDVSRSKREIESEKKVIKEMIDDYDMSDPDAEEALSILREMYRDLED